MSAGVDPTLQRRAGERTPVSLPCTLKRRKGNPISCTTVDLGDGGMCVRTERPLAVDEELTFDLPLPHNGSHVDGMARVLREHARSVYALRFEGLDEQAARAVSQLVREAA